MDINDATIIILSAFSTLAVLILVMLCRHIALSTEKGSHNRRVKAIVMAGFFLFICLCTAHILLGRPQLVSTGTSGRYNLYRVDILGARTYIGTYTSAPTETWDASTVAKILLDAAYIILFSAFVLRGMSRKAIPLDRPLKRELVYTALFGLFGIGYFRNKKPAKGLACLVLNTAAAALLAFIGAYAALVVWIPLTISWAHSVTGVLYKNSEMADGKEGSQASASV